MYRSERGKDSALPQGPGVLEAALPQWGAETMDPYVFRPKILTTATPDFPGLGVMLRWETPVRTGQDSPLLRAAFVIRPLWVLCSAQNQVSKP